MLLTHNAHLERIINLIMEIKGGSKTKGKEEKESREIINYIPDEDEFY